MATSTKFPTFPENYLSSLYHIKLGIISTFNRILERGGDGGVTQKPKIDPQFEFFCIVVVEGGDSSKLFGTSQTGGHFWVFGSASLSTWYFLFFLILIISLLDRW